jgi:hypothetical protein
MDEGAWPVVRDFIPAYSLSIVSWSYIPIPQPHRGVLHIYHKVSPGPVQF